MKEDVEPGAILPVMRMFFWALLTLGTSSLAPSLAVAEPSPAPSSEIVDLAVRLMAAKTQKEEDRVLAHVDLRSRGPALRQEISKREFEISLKGDYIEAERLCHLIRRVAERSHDEAGLAVADTQLSAVLREFGEYHEALAALDRALVFYSKHPDDIASVRVHQSRGIIFLYQGDFARALVDLTQALQLAEKANYREGIIPALNSTGEVYREQGLPERALEFYARARAVVADDNAWNMAFIFNNIGMSYEAMGDLPKAVEFIDRARSVADKSKMRPRVATSLAVLGKIDIEQGKLDDAHKLYKQSLALSRELHDPASEGRALVGLAEVFRTRKDFAKALDFAQQAVAVFEKTGAPDRVLIALTSAGRSLRALGREKEARDTFEKAIADVEQLRANIAGTETESEAFLEGRLGPYQEMISLLANANEREAALSMSERASARVLLDVIARGGAELSRSVLTESERARQGSLDRRIAQLNHTRVRVRENEKVDPKQLEKIENDLREVRTERESLDAELAAAHSELRRFAPPQPIQSIAELGSLVADRQTVLLKFSVGESETVLFVITAETDGKPSLEAYSIKISCDEIVKRTGAFRAQIAQRDLNWQKSARDLYDLLLRPAKSKLQNARQLIIVPDGPLWECPFRILQDGDEHLLLEQCSISLAPSLSILARLESAIATRSTKNDLLAFANPALPQSLSPLATAKEELSRKNWEPLPEMEGQVRDLEKLYQNHAPKIFVGSAASEERAKRELPSAELIHFATHGVLNDRAPLYSYLLLAQDETAGGEDGMLEAWELMHMQLKAHLAILCGCDTARGRIGAGEGVLGLSWSFFVAGCPATIVSQWKVDSASARPLMVALHRELLAGASRTAALREAALELRKDPRYRHPFYWAPFVLIGDPR